METIYWIWLSLRCGAGSELGSFLLKHFLTPRAVYEASREELLALEGMEEKVVEALMDHDLDYAERILAYCERVNVGIMTLASPIYPRRLRSIHARPILLYYRGRIPNIDDNVLIACVGTRKCSPQGAATAERLGAELAKAGAIVVSGMASGIDSASQRGVLSVGGHTIAVLGCGIDRVYPPENEELMRRIAETGTLLTEYAPGTEPNGKNFPIRNRIISGLSQGTVVVEADLFSGSLITARDAERQGRDLFAFPGNPEDSRSDGTNDLIRKGAKLVTCAADILGEYDLLYPHRIFVERIPSGNLRSPRNRRVAANTSFPPSNVSKLPYRFDAARPKKSAEKIAEPAMTVKEPKDTSCLSERERTVLSVISGTMSSEAIEAALTQKTGMAQEMGTLLGELTMLEVEGFLEALPGDCYRLL